jgi:hypothetical protein
MNAAYPFSSKLENMLMRRLKKGEGLCQTGLHALPDKR